MLSFEESMREQLQGYAKEVAENVVCTDFNILSEIAAVVIATKKSNSRIFIAGNGGSAATASHMANDLIKGCRVHNREGFKAICLNDPSPVVTCLANDFSYEEIYSIQLRTLAEKGDLLIVFSGSGNSPNIVSAVETANEMGLKTIGFSGRDGGKLKGLCSLLLIAPTDSMEQLEDMHMLYEHALVSVMRGKLEDMWGIEIAGYPGNRKIHSALFDFDGTISLIREGWQQIMIPYFIEVLSETPEAEDTETVAQVVTDFVDKLTGKQTIFQCITLDEEVIKRGGAKRDPLEYKKEYLRRLMEHIKDRRESLRNGTSKPEEYLVPGIIELLKELKAEGINIYLASGTDEEDVLEEARLLGIDTYFEGNIYGARDEITDCSKELVIKKIIAENGITGDRLISFGDGYVEIELVKNIGGYTFGVASDEARKKGINEWKRRRLLSAGADCIIPDFSEVKKIVEFALEK